MRTRADDAAKGSDTAKAREILRETERQARGKEIR